MCDAGSSTSYTIYHLLLIPAPPLSIVVSLFLTSTIIIINTSMTLKEYSGCIKSERLKIRSTQNLDKRGRYPDRAFSHFPVLCHVSLQEVICLRKCCLPVGFGILPPENQFYCYQIIHTILWLNEVSCFFFSPNLKSKDFFGHTKFLISIVYALPI